MTTVSLIESALRTAFHPEKLEVVDDRAEHQGHAHQDSGHFTVVIQSPIFAGKSSIERHRMVYSALGSLMQTHIHTLKIKVSVGV